jgi:glucose/arabinose dehydrogenase
MGHRVIQGLSVNDGIVISTEHGPRGGDEINKILSNKNYGWPIASLGERYDFKYKNNKLTYKKNHSKLNFEDPIFSFIPSIGISEIIKLPSDFSIYYDNHYLLSSLNGRSLYFIRFDQNFKKAVTIEKVFINKRIRDIKYLKDNDNIILALEEDGEIGIISNN